MTSANTTHIQHIAADAYTRFGIPEGQYTTLSETDTAKLLELLKIAETTLHRIPCRLFPTSFSPGDKRLSAFPVDPSFRWSSLESYLRNHKAISVLSLLPLFWQIESPMSNACRSSGAMLFLGDADNIPISSIAVTTLSSDTVIGEVEHVSSLITDLNKRSIPLPQTLIVIHRHGDSWSLTEATEHTPCTIIQEVHLFPGISILDQCSKLADLREPVFHLNTQYTLETEKQSSYISSSSKQLFPLYRLKLPYVLEAGGSCECGKKIFKKT